MPAGWVHEEVRVLFHLTLEPAEEAEDRRMGGEIRHSPAWGPNFICCLEPCVGGKPGLLLCRGEPLEPNPFSFLLAFFFRKTSGEAAAGSSSPKQWLLGLRSC